MVCLRFCECNRWDDLQQVAARSQTEPLRGRRGKQGGVRRCRELEEIPSGSAALGTVVFLLALQL